MATYILIPDADIQPGALGTSSLFFRLRDNPLAIIEGNATIKINSNAFLLNSINGNALAIATMNGDRIINNTIDGSKFLDGSIGLGKLKIQSNEISGNLAANATVDIAFPQGVLNYRLEDTNNTVRITGLSDTGTAAQPGFRLINTSGSTPTNYVLRWQYIA